MTSVADGSLLDFMNVVDICSIFGNALDNAIESVLRIDDRKKGLYTLRYLSTTAS
jgi:sensor histidine kinase regulating citrate/malate metabolism